MSNVKYITRLCEGQCTMGTMKNYLNLPTDHGIIFNDEDHPLMNANDHMPNQHVIHFGRCSSPLNPGNWKPIPINCKCMPMTFMPWVEMKKDHIIEGAPALTDKSKLMCFYGGIITIVPPDEQAADEQAEREASHAEYDE